MKTTKKFRSFMMFAMTIGLTLLSVSACKDSKNEEEFKDKYISGYARYNSEYNYTEFGVFVGRADGVTPITDAIVKVNGIVCAYNSSRESYCGTFDLYPGDEAEFTITCEGDSFVRMVKMPGLIEIISPADGSILNRTVENLITWKITGDEPDNINVRWGNSGSFVVKEIPGNSLSYIIPAYQMEGIAVEVIAENSYEDSFLYFYTIVSDTIIFTY